MQRNIKSDIYNKANKIYAENGTLVLISSFIVWASVVLLLLFPVFGLGLSFFAMCFLCLGFKKIVIDLINGKNPKIETVFDYFKDCLSAFCLKVATIVIVFLWGLVFIVPGVIMALNFVYAPYILAEDRKIGAIKAMQKSKSMVYGNRANILVLYLTMSLVTTLVLMLSSFLVIIFNMLVVMPIWINISVAMFITLFVFFVFILPYFEIVFASMYTEVKKLEQKPKTTKKSKIELKEQIEEN